MYQQETRKAANKDNPYESVPDVTVDFIVQIKPSSV